MTFLDGEIMRSQILNRLFIVIGLPIAFVATSAHGAVEGKTAAASPFVTLSTVASETDGDVTAVTLQFSQKPTWAGAIAIEEHGSFLQVSLPGTIIPNPGQFFEGNGPLIRKVAAFQTDSQTGAIRLFVTREAAKVKPVARAELLDRRLVITIDNKAAGPATTDAISQPATAIDPMAQGAGVVIPGSATMTPVSNALEGTAINVGSLADSKVTADDIIARTEVKTDIPPPSQLVTGPQRETTTGLTMPKIGVNIPSLDGKIVPLAIFSGIMLLALLLLNTLSPRLRRLKSKFKGTAPAVEEEILTIKTLTTTAVGPKQKLSLIQVGQEKFLISVTPQGITFLTAIGAQKPVIPTYTQAIAAPVQAAIGGPRTALPRSDREVLAKGFSRPQVESRHIDSEGPRTLATRRTDFAQHLEEPEVGDRDDVIRPTRTISDAPRKRINIAIGDDGVRNLDRETARVAQEVSSAGQSLAGANSSRRAIEDVTKMIREKMRNLPNAS